MTQLGSRVVFALVAALTLALGQVAAATAEDVTGVTNGLSPGPALVLSGESVYLQPGPMIFRLDIVNGSEVRDAAFADALPCTVWTCVRGHHTYLISLIIRGTPYLSRRNGQAPLAAGC